MRVMLIATTTLLGLGAVAPAQAYLGEGIQGRPHGGHTAERLYAYRHGVPYAGPHRRHHLYGSPYRSYTYGR